MRDDKLNYVLVGGVVISMVAALILWIALVSGRTGATDDYHVFFDDVTGLKTGVEILYQGYRVGLIDDIQPREEGGFRIDLSVRRGWPIPVDSLAAISSGIFSAPVINIEAGESTELLAPGSRIPSTEAGDAFAAVGNVATNASRLIEERIDPILAEVSESVPEIIGNIEKVSSEMKTTMQQINAVLGQENVNRVASILENMDTAADDVNELIADMKTTRATLDGLLGKVDAMLQKDQGDVAVAVADLRYSLATLARHIDAIGTNLETTTRNLNEFSRQVRGNPGVLLSGREGGDDDQ